MDALSLRPRLSTDRRTYVEHFVLVSTPAGAYADPAEVPFARGIPAHAPGTVAAALREAGTLDLSLPPDLDGQDHWYRAQLSIADGADEQALVCEGLATVAEVWLDGVSLGQSESMFTTFERVLATAAGEHELVLCFRALTPWLARRRPRPRWRTRLIDAQQLRYVRTSLLGRMPGLGPRLPAVGPHRAVYVETRARFRLGTVRLTPSLARGSFHVEVRLTALVPGAQVRTATLYLAGVAGTGEAALTVRAVEDGYVLAGEARVEGLRAWWPHTHGEQPLSDAHVALDDGTTLALGRVGFRTLEIDRGLDGKGFGLVINGVPVFARGACFTTSDLVSLGTNGLAATLEAAKRAGMNMLRVPGIATYAPPPFHALCDALGILVFQDFMLANMDYPAGDALFDAQLASEVRELLAAIGHRPSTAVLCGGSEVLQQAAMLGVSAEVWHSTLFTETLPALVREGAADVPYVEGSPSGGALPFHVDEGVSHYYGVGAYLRPLDDLRRSGVRFAAECLAFANVPRQESIVRFMRDLEMPFHHPRWKERVPRDRGVGWDFEDVRDHYVERLFGVEARAVRASDPERYLMLGHAAVGALITAALDEWRRAASTCRGALLFWLKDLWLGAGFGLLDAEGLPKAAYYYAARAFAPLKVALTDEGLNGLATHVQNDGPEARALALTWALYRDGETPVLDAHTTVTLPAHGTATLALDRYLPRFADSAYAYRFGPPPHDLVVATLSVAGEVVSRAFHLPLGHARAPESDLGLAGSLHVDEGGVTLTVRTRRFAQCVTIEVDGYLPEDDFFHLAPGEERAIRLAPRAPAASAPRGRLYALNARTPVVLAPA